MLTITDGVANIEDGIFGASLASILKSERSSANQVIWLTQALLSHSLHCRDVDYWILWRKWIRMISVLRITFRARASANVPNSMISHGNRDRFSYFFSSAWILFRLVRKVRNTGKGYRGNPFISAFCSACMEPQHFPQTFPAKQRIILQIPDTYVLRAWIRGERAHNSRGTAHSIFRYISGKNRFSWLRVTNCSPCSTLFVYKTSILKARRGSLRQYWLRWAPITFSSYSVRVAITAR